MASSVYVYRNIDEYKKYYTGKESQLIHQIPIVDMFVDTDKGKLFVITNQDQETKKQNIDWFRTLVHVRSSELTKDILSNNEFHVRPVQHGKIMYDGKNSKIGFFPRIRGFDMVHQVDRFIGNSDDKKKYLLEYDYRFYDFSQDRINLILGDVQNSFLTRLRLTLENLVRSKYPRDNI